MRQYKVPFAVLILLLLAYTWWLTANPAVPNKSFVSGVFVGFTNKPSGGSPARLYALFRLACAETNKYVWFNTDSWESNDGRGWKYFAPIAGPDSGGGFLTKDMDLEVAWPPGLQTNVAWRLCVPVVEEADGGLAGYLNRKLDKQLVFFHKFGKSKRLLIGSSGESQ